MRNLRRVPPRTGDETSRRGRAQGAGPSSEGPGTRRDAREGRRLPAGICKAPARNEGQTGLPRKAGGDFPRPTQDVDIAFGCPAGNAGDQATGRGKAECPARAEADFGLAESPGFFDPPTDSRNATEASSCRIECKTGSAGSPAGPPRRAHGAAEGHGNAPADGPPAAPLRV